MRENVLGLKLVRKKRESKFNCENLLVNILPIINYNKPSYRVKSI